MQQATTDEEISARNSNGISVYLETETQRECVFAFVCVNCCCCHLERQLVRGLGDVALDDVGSSNSWHVDGRLFVDQQMISLIVNLVHTHTQTRLAVRVAAVDKQMTIGKDTET